MSYEGKDDSMTSILRASVALCFLWFVAIAATAAEPKAEDERDVESTVAARFDHESGVAVVLDMPVVISLLIGKQPRGAA